ncbi:MAG: hypothetical protein J0I54_22625 [Bosea sp.]|uniref:hypothetical protein n=1 Tax=unclassified Bosea (in: a-proteobacteria) TaxID=2653178 RepID=UPI001AC7887C|nr:MULTISPECIES: hypothetical protein [unclassified Bosea (in: a-proteobacteria)]MBN9459432.1 hypothetical protein [Bosea sp. (in: a-proteobacteria)]
MPAATIDGTPGLRQKWNIKRTRHRVVNGQECNMPAATEKYAFVIAIGPSHAASAATDQDQVLATLTRCFDDASFEIVVIDADLVDGNYMLVPRRGTIGAGDAAIKPQPPSALYHAIDAKLAEMRFLQPATAH